MWHYALNGKDHPPVHQLALVAKKTKSLDCSHAWLHPERDNHYIKVPLEMADTAPHSAGATAVFQLPETLLCISIQAANPIEINSMNVFKWHLLRTIGPRQETCMYSQPAGHCAVHACLGFISYFMNIGAMNAFVQVNSSSRCSEMAISFLVNATQ